MKKARISLRAFCFSGGTSALPVNPADFAAIAGKNPPISHKLSFI
jgi:hypothetical protein